MAPLKPHWNQPSHPDIQEVFINDEEFTSKSLSKISLPPFGLYAKMSFPPCTLAEEPTYATVQFAKDKHLSLNSDLLYINHSCEPSLIFDTANLSIIAGPNGLQPGEELTFFYPSTEWEMAQSFDCLCGKSTCRGRIGGAKVMKKEQLDGLWINGHIRELLEQQSQASTVENGKLSENGNATGEVTREANDQDHTTQALRDALRHAELAVEASRTALDLYIEASGSGNATSAYNDGRLNTNGKNLSESEIEPRSDHGNSHNGTNAGLARSGPTSRELSGEMGGDTTAA